MESEWIRKRFEQSEEDEAGRQLRNKWEANAAAAYDSMFDNLKGQVEADVTSYNRLFSARPECKATFENTSDGFRVEVKQKAARVKKKHGTTVIGIEYVLPNREGIISPGTFDHLDTAPNERGDICYKHKTGFLTDVSQASELVLDRILCN